MIVERGILGMITNVVNVDGEKGFMVRSRCFVVAEVGYFAKK